MTLEYDGVQVRTSIGPIVVNLLDENGTKSVDARIAVRDQRGNPMWVWEGDLQPHLPAAAVTELVDFLNALRTQAETELLP